MDDVRDELRSDENLGGQIEEVGQISHVECEDSASMTLVEVMPGVAVVFGEVPDGIELISLDLMPSFDRAQLSTALGSLGNAGTIVGNVAETVSSAQGLFRVNDATLSLLKSGGQMAVKDGANLGAILQNGKIVAQARFIPVSMTAATAIAAIGPAVAMIGLQIQLGEISGLVCTNIQLTRQTLKAIQNEQWAELEGLAESVDEAIKETRELGAITESVWEPIAANDSIIRKQLKLYRKKVAGHIQELGKVEGRARREYLESNAEAIVFDSYALWSTLKTHAEYRSLRAALVRTRSINNENEAQLFDRIVKNTHKEIEESLAIIRPLTVSLVRELRIIAELPGRATVPLTKNRKNAKASQLTCEQLLDAIEPLANMLQPSVEMPAVPDIVCAPEGLELDPYLRILRWFLEDGEKLRCVAFPYKEGAHKVADIVPERIDKLLDWTRAVLPSGRIRDIVQKFASCIFVAITDQRIITADLGKLLKEGTLGPEYPLDEVRHVRIGSNPEKGMRPTIEVTTERQELHWEFPHAEAPDSIDGLAAILAEGI